MIVAMRSLGVTSFQWNSDSGKQIAVTLGRTTEQQQPLRIVDEDQITDDMAKLFGVTNG